jgi:hypothetical protein
MLLSIVLRREVAAQGDQLRGEVAAQRAQLHGDIEDTRRYMRVLHEEVIGRLATIQAAMSRDTL